MRMTHKDINLILNNLETSHKINFGLYFKKFIELNENDDFKKYIDQEEDTRRNIPKIDGNETRLKNLYEKIDSNYISNVLNKKNESLSKYLKELENKNYAIFEKKFKLQSRMILGIGETTATEIGMIFDYTTGVPYIPASSIKGVIRFSYIQDLIKKLESDNELRSKVIELEHNKNNESNEVLIENAKDTNIYLLFGGDKLIKEIDKQNEYWILEGTYSGAIKFFDSYPVKKPKLDIDIINVHYQDYYKDGSIPPTDTMDPKPLKFLTVASGTEFIFRYAIDKDRVKNDNIISEFEKIFLTALKENGLGAKTKIGYGIFID